MNLQFVLENLSPITIRRQLVSRQPKFAWQKLSISSRLSSGQKFWKPVKKFNLDFSEAYFKTQKGRKCCSFCQLTLKPLKTFRIGEFDGLTGARLMSVVSRQFLIRLLVGSIKKLGFLKSLLAYLEIDKAITSKIGYCTKFHLLKTFVISVKLLRPFSSACSCVPLNLLDLWGREDWGWDVARRGCTERVHNSNLWVAESIKWIVTWQIKHLGGKRSIDKTDFSVQLEELTYVLERSSKT